jgi:hypothetical protein
MDTIGIYKDNFDQIFQHLGWHDIRYKSPYGDPEVIRQRWLSPPNTDKKFSKQAFFNRFGDTTFRKILSHVGLDGGRSRGILLAASEKQPHSYEKNRRFLIKRARGSHAEVVL